MTKVLTKKRHYTAKELAEKYNINPRTVRKYFSQDRDEYLKENALRRAEMFELRQKGLKLTEIAIKFNVSKSCVSHLIKKHIEKYNNQIDMF